MKKLLLLFLVIISAHNHISAYDFSTVCSTGQTLNYNINSSVNKTVELEGSTSLPTGLLIIPGSVINSSITYSVTSIGASAFLGCTGLTSITIPSSVTSIEGAAFMISGLTSITIPSSVTSIGDDAFLGCTGLTSITIPSSVTSVSYGIVANCTGLTSITIPSSVTSIGGEAFMSSGLTSITIPTSVTSIGDMAFYGCTGLWSLIIPNSVTSIGGSAFSTCTGLTSLTIPNSVDSIGVGAFEYCTGLTSVTLPNSIKSIPVNTFYGCYRLTSFTIPNSVDSIGHYSFYGCSGLTSLTIPNSVTSIENCAFYGCSGLTSIYANSTLPIDLSTSDSVFYKVNKTTCTLYVPVGSKSAYQAADQWKDFTHIVEMTTAAIPTIIKSTISLYPNPTSDYFKVNGIDCKTLISMKDLNGKTLFTKQINSSDKININSLSKGIYIIEVNTNEALIIKKIVKN
jgi:hypothetical protein